MIKTHKDEFIVIDNHLISLVSDLLNKSCNNGNIEASKAIVDLIIDCKFENQIDFTKFFISASSSDAIEICNYFIENKFAN